jgi:hypothetical protein
VTIFCGHVFLTKLSLRVASAPLSPAKDGALIVNNERYFIKPHGKTRRHLLWVLLSSKWFKTSLFQTGFQPRFPTYQLLLGSGLLHCFSMHYFYIGFRALLRSHSFFIAKFGGALIRSHFFSSSFRDVLRFLVEVALLL